MTSLAALEHQESLLHGLSSNLRGAGGLAGEPQSGDECCKRGGGQPSVSRRVCVRPLYGTLPQSKPVFHLTARLGMLWCQMCCSSGRSGGSLEVWKGLATSSSVHRRDALSPCCATAASAVAVLLEETVSCVMSTFSAC